MANNKSNYLKNGELSKIIGKVLAEKRKEVLAEMYGKGQVEKKLAERINKRVWEQVL